MSDDAKVLTTAEVESWVYYVSTEHESESTLPVDRTLLLATTRALEILSDVADVSRALRNVDMSSGETVSAPAEILEHPLYRAMLDTILERDAARARVEKAEAELDSARFARDRYANTIGLIESAIGFSGANPVEETIERVRRLKAERDEARTTMRRWESERDETMFGVIRQRDEARAERDEARAALAKAKGAA